VERVVPIAARVWTAFPGGVDLLSRVGWEECYKQIVKG
jgi:hypothetical protein